jgi:hypothetical protein
MIGPASQTVRVGSSLAMQTPLDIFQNVTVHQLWTMRIQEPAQGVCHQVIHSLKPTFPDQRL